MAQTTLVVATDTAIPDASRWVEPLVRAWPRPNDVPTVRRLDLHTWMQARDGDLPTAPMLAILGGDLDARRFDLVVEALLSRPAPSVVLAPDPVDSFRRAEDEGLVVEPWETEPRALAGVLHALMRRQRAVADLASEARLTRVSAAGLAEELSHVHEEMEIAASIQREIMPRTLPGVDGIDCGLFFRPAGQVSGDIYDCRVLEDGRLSLFVADAVGHGVPAALLTMLVAHSLVRSEVVNGRTTSLPPARVLDRLNAAMCARQFTSPRFATAVYALIDPGSGEAIVSGAGHPSPMRYKGDLATPVETSGPLLGIFDEAEFDEVRFALEPGETLVFYSDGFETAFGGRTTAEGRPLPSRAYLDAFQRILGTAQPADRLCGAMADLAEDLDRQAGSLHQVDDLTALAVRRLAPATRSREPLTRAA
ncbi:MAG: PP2C family protein-serine/threonine phosphatase [Phycisphaeraceae bacterium]|nr:PP2C family protein-serine/threonine phosphatase [Phycisphaeraceae bacterium]